MGYQSIKTIREILGFEPTQSHLVTGEKTAPPVPDLPVAEPVEDNGTPAPRQEAANEAGSLDVEPKFQIIESELAHRHWYSRDVVKYPLIFIFAFAFFYVALNSRSVFQQVSNTFFPMKSEQSTVLAASDSTSIEYNHWIQKYYVHENDATKLAPDADPDGDGLTNLDEFYLGTNPLNAFTASNGYSDGENVVNGYNPLAQNSKLSRDQQDIAKNHLDIVAISDRIIYEKARGIAGATIYTTQLQNQGPKAVEFIVDTSQVGLVEIPKLGVKVPLVWNKDFSKVQDDLKNGVVHHPATVYPGDIGLSSIHGHSSGYPWDGDYKTAFTKINFLEAGDEVFVTVHGTNGQDRRYRYVVKSKKTYSISDPKQFEPPSPGSYLNLSTSWPVGTARERYVVTTELSGV